MLKIAGRALIRCLVWFGGLSLGEVLAHAQTAQVNASTLDFVVGVHPEAVVLEESSGGQTHLRRDSRDTGGNQRGLGALVECARNTAAGKSRACEQKIKVAVEGVGSEACESTIRFGNDRLALCESLPPAIRVSGNWSPRGNLLRRVEGRANTRIEGGLLPVVAGL